MGTRAMFFIVFSNSHDPASLHGDTLKYDEYMKKYINVTVYNEETDEELGLHSVNTTGIKECTQEDFNVSMESLDLYYHYLQKNHKKNQFSSFYCLDQTNLTLFGRHDDFKRRVVSL
jgi:hypothetical protein